MSGAPPRALRRLRSLGANRMEVGCAKPSKWLESAGTEPVALLGRAAGVVMLGLPWLCRCCAWRAGLPVR